MRVLFLSSMYFKPEGTYSGLTVHRQAVELQRKGVEVRVLCPIRWFSASGGADAPSLPRERRFRGPLTLEIDGVSVTYVPYPNPPLGLFPGAHAALLERALARSVRQLRPRFRFDLIHGHHLFPVAFLAHRIGDSYGVPAVISAVGSDVHTHPNRNEGIRKRTIAAIRRSAAVIGVSSALVDQIHELALPHRAGRVVYLGVDDEEFAPRGSPQEFRSRLGLPQNGVGICTVCWLGVEKGVLDLLDAFEQLPSGDPPAWLAIVGDGPVHDELASRIRSRGLEGRVFLAGARPHAQVPEWLNASDVFVLASYNEGLPNVILEAMACGRPVVATDVGGVAEAVDDGVSGILVPSGEVESLRNALAHLMDSPSLRKNMGNAGRERARSHFSWSRTTENLIQVYRECLSAAEE